MNPIFHRACLSLITAVGMAALPALAGEGIPHLATPGALPPGCAAPLWSAEAIQKNQYGMVSMKLLIGADGKVTQLQQLGSSGIPMLDQVTAAAIGKCVFQPAMADGKPVAAWTRLNYVWTPDEAPNLLVDAESVRDAARVYRRRAQAGDSYAQNLLGDIYRSGHGFPADFAEAASWYAKAAPQGHAGAQYNLAMMHQLGVGVPKSAADAAQWMAKAAAQGHADAQDLVGVMTENGSGLAKDETAAVAWYRQAAAQNNPHAQYNLARCLEFGIGVDQDSAAAAGWYAKARAQGVDQDRVTMMLAGTLPKPASSDLTVVAAKPAMVWHREPVKYRQPGLEKLRKVANSKG